MSSSDVQGIMAALLGIVVLTFVVGGGYYVWYGLVLARLFPKLGGEGWKGWVPILNEAEILARGGVPAWSVVFYFIPVLQLYGLYLKAMAVQRINLQFGRGVGLAILGMSLTILGMMSRKFGKLGAEIVGTRKELKTEIAGLRTELKGDIARLDARMDAGFGRVETRLTTLEQRTYELSMRLPPLPAGAE